MEERIRLMEARMELKEREDRRGNIVIKGLSNNKSSIKEEVEILVREVMNLKVEIKEVREIGKRLGKEKRMVIAKLGSREEKRQIMQKKGILKGRGERIEDDWTWKERKMQHKIRCIAEEEMRKGKRVRIRYGLIEIEGERWKWDESKEELRNGKGERRTVKDGERKGEGE
jgi:hypothetical protein